MTRALYEALKQEHHMDEPMAQEAFDFVLHALEENKDLLWELGKINESNHAKAAALGLCAMMIEIGCFQTDAGEPMYIPRSFQ